MSDDYSSDQWILDLFDGWFDPCPLGGAVYMDGLNLQDWSDQTYVNPPYSNPLPWVEKAILESKKGYTIAMLLKHDSSTEWWRRLHEAGAQFLMVNGRLKHGVGTSAAFPSVIVILSSWDAIKEEES